MRQTRCPKTPGNKSTPHPDPAEPPRRRAHKRKGQGTYAKERPPLISLVSRDTGAPRCWVCEHAADRTCGAVIAENIPVRGAMLSTDAWPGDHGSPAAHASVRPGVGEWARDDNRAGRREVHGHTGEGAGAALRTYLRAFRGVHTRYRPRYVATSEARVHAKRVTPELIPRRCVGNLSAHTGYT